MTVSLLLGELTAALALVAISGYVLTLQIERIGVRLHFTAGLLGSLVALGADSPELSSAIAALLSGHGEVSIGVVLGSNIFNVAGLLGISALLAKDGIAPNRHGLALNGVAALLITVMASLEVMSWVPAWLGFLLVLLVFVPYGVLISLQPSQLAAWPIPSAIRGFLRRAATGGAAEKRPKDGKAERQAPPAPEGGALLEFLAPIPTLVAVIAGSTLMVRRATTLGDRWHVPGAVLGALVLATLTGIPNLVASVSLARRGRGTAVVSEALNSNSLNLIFGLSLPAVFVAQGSPSNVALLALVTLLVTTVLALLLASRRSGLRWPSGLGLLASYLMFVVAVCVLVPRM
ncbi:MAG: hypothetical protein ABI548_27355 [Polyangiaceae bacterium]